MIITFGRQEFVIDPETDFIIRHSCYLDGKNCHNCDINDECFAELDYVLEHVRNNCMEEIC